METISRLKFLKYVGVSGAALMLPKISSSRTDTPSLDPKADPAVFRMAHLTDIHVEAGKESEAGFANALQAVNSLADKPEFILNGGDSIMNSALNLSRERVKNQWDLFHKILLDNNSLPVHHCIGNHDLYGWSSPNQAHVKGKKWALDEYKMDQPYYAFEKGNWKFIVLDSIHGRDTIPGYYAKLDETQTTWLQNELEKTPATQFVCIVSHIPILAVCTMFIGKNKDKEHWSIPNNALHADANELTALFYQHPNIKACLSGHIHLVDHVNYLGIDYFCNGAVSGSWWKGNYHQFPPSYSIMSFHDNGKVEREVKYYNWQNAT